jgi:hypothetical protein
MIKFAIRLGDMYFAEQGKGYLLKHFTFDRNDIQLFNSKDNANKIIKYYGLSKYENELNIVVIDEEELINTKVAI